MKIAYFVSHPIQYQAPLLRRIAQERDIELTVFFSSDLSIRGYADKGFGGLHVQWDTPLLDGYAHQFLPAFRSNAEPGFAAPISHGIFSRLRQGSFDAAWVHGYHTVNSLHAIAAAKTLGIPILLRTDSTLDDRPRGRVKLLLKKAFFATLRPGVQGVLTVGERNAQYWRAALGQQVPLFLMPYAVDNDYFRCRTEQAAPHREDLRRELNLNPGRPIFLFASKLLKRKRCLDLVEAFLRLSSVPSVESPAYLLIAGDGEDRPAIEQRVRQAKAANIRMLGFKNQSELPRLFDLCDVFVLPSIHEPWGLIVNEVMSASRAIVLSDQVGCAPDLLQDGVNGVLFPARNVEALHKVLRRFVEEPPLASAMGLQAAAIIDRFTIQRDIEGLRRALAFVVPGFAA